MLKTKKMFFRVPTQCFSNTNEGTWVIFPIVNEDSIEELGAQCGLSQQFCNNFVGLYDVVITCNRSSNKNENEKNPGVLS